MTKGIYAGLRAALPLLVSVTGLQAAHVVDLPANISEPGVQVEDVHIGLSYSEGPTVDLQGNVFFSEDPDVQTGRIWKITPDGAKSAFKDPSRGANGLEIDNQGRLNICMLDSVLRVEADGKVTVLAATGQGGLTLGRVNDLTISSNGSMFFSNLNGNTVFYRNPEGEIRTRNFNGANGVEWIEEKGFLYIASMQGLRKCQVDNQTGEIGTCANFAGGTDGLTTDVEGNVYRASWTDGKVFVHDSTGRELGTITIDSRDVQGKRSSRGAMGNTSNCHFGGPDRKTLFITGDGGLYKVQLRIAGRVRPGRPTGIRQGGGTHSISALQSRAAGSRAMTWIYFRAGAGVSADGRAAKLTLQP